MKKYIRYIKASQEPDAIDLSKFNNTPIIPHVGASYYDDFLNKKELAYKQEAKNRTGQIVMMSPNEYYHDCSIHGFDHIVPVSLLKNQRNANSSSINWLTSQLEQGKKFNLPYINYADHTQEGLHRMMVLGDKYGWNTKFPVLIVSVYDREVERKHMLQAEAYEFQEDEFNNVCQIAIDNLNLSAFDSTDSMIEAIRQEVQNEASEIDVLVEVNNIDGVDVIQIWLTEYKGLKFQYISNPFEYELSQPDSKSSNDDIDDIDISDLFFNS